MYLARKAAIHVSGEKTGATAYGGFSYWIVPAGEYTLRADMWDAPGRCELIFNVGVGETYFFQVDPRSESFESFAVSGTVADLASSGAFAGLAGGLAGGAVESYGKECGGAFRLYPVDPVTGYQKLQDLRLTD